MRPSASERRAPFPSRGWNGVRAYVFTRNASSRATTASGDSSCSNKGGASFGCAVAQLLGCRGADRDLRYTCAKRREGRFELRAHTARGDAGGDHLFDAICIERVNERAVRVEESRDVGEKQKLFCLMCDGDRRRRRVGIH